MDLKIMGTLLRSVVPVERSDLRYCWAAPTVFNTWVPDDIESRVYGKNGSLDPCSTLGTYNVTKSHKR